MRIATTLSVIGAVVGEFFGGPLYALGIYITLETGAQPLPVGMGGHRARLRRSGSCCTWVVVALERLVMPWYAARETGPMTTRRVAYHPCGSERDAAIVGRRRPPRM